MLHTILFLWLAMHPVHVTMTSVEYHNDMDTVKVYVHFFYDDLLLDYKLFNKKADMTQYSLNEPLPENELSKYIDDRLIISVGKTVLKGRITDMSLDNNELRVYLSYEIKGRKTETISIENRFLINLYEDQANMTIIKINDFEEGLRFTPVYCEKTFNLQ